MRLPFPALAGDADATLGDMVTAAAVTAVTGAGAVGIGHAALAMVITGQLVQWEAVTFLIPSLMIFALFTAWPVGIVSGIVVGKIAGCGYWQAALSGSLTALILSWPLELHRSGVWIMAGFLAVGIGAGLFGWRAAIRRASYRH